MNEPNGMGETRGRMVLPSRQALEARLQALDARPCLTAAELHATLCEQVALGAEIVRLAVLEELADCLERLFENTPVDSGRARAGWFVSATPSDDTPPAASPSKSSAASPDSGDLAAFMAEHLFYAADSHDADAYHIINNVEYLPQLEAGWSKQQPGGFMALFAAELKAGLARRAREDAGGLPW